MTVWRNVSIPRLHAKRILPLCALFLLAFVELVIPVGKVIDVLYDCEDECLQVLSVLTRYRISVAVRMSRKIPEGMQLLAPIEKTFINYILIT